MLDRLGKMLREQGKSDIHLLMAVLLGKLLCSCFLFDLHHPTDDSVTETLVLLFALLFFIFFPSYDMQNYFSLILIIHGKGLLLPEVCT